MIAKVQILLGTKVQLKSSTIRTFPGRKAINKNSFSKNLGLSSFGPYTFIMLIFSFIKVPWTIKNLPQLYHKLRCPLWRGLICESGSSHHGCEVSKRLKLLVQASPFRHRQCLSQNNPSCRPHSYFCSSLILIPLLRGCQTQRCCLTTSKICLLLCSSVDMSWNNMTCLSSNIILPLFLAACMTQILSWKFKNLIIMTRGAEDCGAPGNLWAHSRRISLQALGFG